MFGSNVNILLTFQKVDQDWSEYVDLDEGSVLCHKGKIKAAVTPLLQKKRQPVVLNLISMNSHRMIFSTGLDGTGSSPSPV